MTGRHVRPPHDHTFGVWGSYVITTGDPPAVAEGACRGGAAIIQYRDKAAGKRLMLDTARGLRHLLAECGILLIINDHIDVALLAGADGVHLGQDDIPIREARRIVPEGFIIGVSTHSIEQAVAAEADGADYIGIGPVFATPTKPDYAPIGIETVRAAADAVNIPLVAIGGLSVENISLIKDAGLVNAAMVRGFAEHTEETVRNVNRMLLGGR